MTCPTGSTSRVTLTPPSCCSASASLPLPCHPLVFIATKRAPSVRHRVVANVATRAKPHFERPSRRSRRAPPMARTTSSAPAVEPMANSSSTVGRSVIRSALDAASMAVGPRNTPCRANPRGEISSGAGLAGNWIPGRLPRSLAGFSTSDDEREAVDREEFARACDHALARSRTPLRRCGRQCDARAERSAKRVWARRRGTGVTSRVAERSIIFDAT